MDILNSNWLIKMLEKSSTTAHGRLLSLFDILEDWLDAPNIVTQSFHEQINTQFSTKKNAHLLQDFLTLEATKAGAAMPEMLANQLYFMALAAVQEKLQANNHKSMAHAKNAASALIAAQTKKEFRITRQSAYVIAASFLAIFIVSGSLLISNLHQTNKLDRLATLHSITQPIVPPVLATSELTASPEQTAALMAQIELMRHGSCHYPEVLQLPDNLKGVYLDVVVNGQISTDPHEQKLAIELINKIQCNYTPMLMANSTG